MKQSINGLWLMSIMIVFISIFIAFVCIQLNYSNAYRLKSDIVTAIEERQGMNSESQELIDQIIDKYSYKTRGRCKVSAGHTVFGITDMVAERITDGNKNNTYEYCITIERKRKLGSPTSGLNGSLDKYYYTVQLFFNFGLPGFGNIYSFSVYGETNAIMYPYDGLYKQNGKWIDEWVYNEGSS